MTPTPLHRCWQHKNMGIKIKTQHKTNNGLDHERYVKVKGLSLLFVVGKMNVGSISYFNTILHLSTSFLISLAFWSRKVAFQPTKLHPSILKTPTHTYFTYLNCCWCETLISCTPPLVHVTWIESLMDKVFL